MIVHTLRDIVKTCLFTKHYIGRDKNQIGDDSALSSLVTSLRPQHEEVEAEQHGQQHTERDTERLGQWIGGGFGSGSL